MTAPFPVNRRGVLRIAAALFSLAAAAAQAGDPGITDKTVRIGISAPLTGPVNIARMVSGVRQGVRDLLPLWEVILSPETLGQILALGIQESDEFHFPENLWVQVVYEFALAYHDQVLHREHLLKALTPLYLGQIASFVLDTQRGGTEQVEAAVESLCQRFEAMKPYLTDRWRWRDE